MNIKYNNRDEIVVSLQNGREEAETMIHIAPAHIKVSAKYSILHGELYEDTTRESTGSRSSIAPPATTHVLLVNEALFRTTVCVEINTTKYYLEWRELFNTEHRYAVVVSSTHNYRARMGPPPRRPIADLANFFMGPRIAEAPAIAMQQIHETNQTAETDADGRNGEETASNSTAEDDKKSKDGDGKNPELEEAISATEDQIMVDVVINLNDEPTSSTVIAELQLNAVESVAIDRPTAAVQLCRMARYRPTKLG